MSDKATRKKILEYLYEIYKKEPSVAKSTDEIVDALGIPYVEVKGALIYLHQKGLIDSYADALYNWSQKINANGIDELEKEPEINSQSTYIDNSSEIEIPKDDFHGIMDVFISHRFVTEDQKLALILREVLKSKKISGYLAESNPEFELKLDEKIQEKIRNSDYVVGIITNFSKNSASVNQELGFALGYNTPLIIMVEKDVPHGILTNSRETQEFTRENFSKQCERVVDYILEKGSKKKNQKFKTSSDQFDLTLDKFTENGNHYVGIRNAKGMTIKSCMVFCNGEKCAWWDTGDSSPRHIYEGGGANVLLPRGFANTNPIIEVKSDNEVIELVELSKIVRRPSSNWNAEDENTAFVDRLNIALGRIRSNLATLRNLFQIFLEHPKVPILPEMRVNLSQKNELVENTQTVVNQASHVLEQDWMNDLNDLYLLAKTNPWVLPGSDTLQIMQCNGCQGVISQIDNLLKRLPNPPV